MAIKMTPVTIGKSKGTVGQKLPAKFPRSKAAKAGGSKHQGGAE